MLQAIRRAIAPYPRATLFELHEQGYDSVFEQLCACVLSIRTLDETSLPASIRLFESARTPQELLKLSDDEIYRCIHGCTFAHQKVSTLRKIAHAIVERGHEPRNFEELTDLPGVGPKCANLVLGIACGVPAIGVDVHVHRITNRWGYVAASTPEKSLAALAKKLPRKHWVEINELLVPFGKHVCTGTLPHCSTCPVYENCERVGVAKHR
jgi:endonuclease-3